MAAVNTLHRIYNKLKARWAMVRDAVEGEHAVKAAGSIYLPQLGGQTETEYDAYKLRALFFEATLRTLNGLAGMVMQKLPKVEAKDTTKDTFLKSLTKDGLSINGFSAVVLREVLMLNKYGILADLPPRISTETEPWLVGYTAESIINWEFMQNVDGKNIPIRIVLEEEWEQQDPKDRFKTKIKKQYRVLELLDREDIERQLVESKEPFELPTKVAGQTDIYRVQVWRAKKDMEPTAVASEDEFILHKEFFPSFQKNAMDKIPFVIVTAEDEDKEDQKPPLEGLASVNMSHYRSSADLEHGRHFTALPTPYIIGVSSEQKDLTIGSQKAWFITNVKAQDVAVGMLEFTGKGLESLQVAIEEKQKQMAILGARLLEEQKKSAEAFETLKLRSAGEQSILAAIANGVSEGINEALQWMNEWDPTLGDITIQLNTEFLRMTMDAQMLTAFVTALQQGKISFKTYYFNLQQRGMYPDDHTEEDELLLIDDEAGKPDNLDLGEDEEEEEEEEEEEGKDK